MKNSVDAAAFYKAMTALMEVTSKSSIWDGQQECRQACKRVRRLVLWECVCTNADGSPCAADIGKRIAVHYGLHRRLFVCDNAHPAFSDLAFRINMERKDQSWQWEVQISRLMVAGIRV